MARSALRDEAISDYRGEINLPSDTGSLAVKSGGVGEYFCIERSTTSDLAIA